MQRPADSPYLHIKEIILRGFAAKSHDIEVMTYLLNNDPVLKKVSIGKGFKCYDHQHGFFRNGFDAVPEEKWERLAAESAHENKKREKCTRQQLLTVLRPGTEDMVSQSGTVGNGTPGPDFWSWMPPPDDMIISKDNPQMSRKSAQSPKLAKSVMVKEQSLEYLSLPFETISVESPNPPLPPLQSLMEVEKFDVADSNVELHALNEKHELGMQFSVNTEEATEALHGVEEASSQGVKPDGSKWWKETGVEQ